MSGIRIVSIRPQYPDERTPKGAIMTINDKQIIYEVKNKLKDAISNVKINVSRVRQPKMAVRNDPVMVPIFRER